MIGSGFGAGARLKDRREFRLVFDEGRKTVGRSLILWHRAAPGAGPARLGLSVSGKVGNAVRRSRLKRLLRESFRLHRAEFADGAELVAYPRPGCSWKSRSDAEKELLELARKAGLLKE